MEGRRLTLPRNPRPPFGASVGQSAQASLTPNHPYRFRTALWRCLETKRRTSPSRNYFPPAFRTGSSAIPSCFRTAAAELPTRSIASRSSASVMPRCLVQYLTSSGWSIAILLRSAFAMFFGIDIGRPSYRRQPLIAAVGAPLRRACVPTSNTVGAAQRTSTVKIPKHDAFAQHFLRKKRHIAGVGSSGSLELSERLRRPS